MPPKPLKKLSATASNVAAQARRPVGGIRRRPAADLASIDTQIPIFGEASAPILCVLDPVVGNVNTKQPFSRQQFDWLTKHLKECGGFSSDDIIFVSACSPVTKEVWERNKDFNAHMKDQFLEFHKLVKAINPRMILTAGAKACQQVVGRAVKITKVRGQPVQDPEICNGITILPLYSPFFAQRHPELESVFKTDIATAGRLHKSDYNIEDSMSVGAAGTNYRWCWDLRPWLIKKPKRISVDVETLGLRPFEKSFRLLTVQICTSPGNSICIPIDYDAGELRHHNSEFWHKGHRAKLIRQLKLLLEDPEVEVVGQNFKFDWLCLYYYLGIEVKNYKHDTIILSHLLDENLLKQNLDDLVRIHVPEMAGYNDIYNNDPSHQGKTRMDLLAPEKMLQYACGDPDAALRLSEVLLDEIQKDKALYNCYNKVSMPAVRAFCWIEQNGFPIDVKALRDFEEELRKIQKEEKKRLLRAIPPDILRKHANTGVGLKPDRAVILKDYLYHHPKGLKLKPVAFTKTGQPSTSSKDAMPYYAADSQFVGGTKNKSGPLSHSGIIDYIKNERLLNTYVRGFYKYIVGGKIRPSYLLHGTVTGRTSSKDPNGQNFPKRGKLVKAYRKIFRAPPGWVFVSCDLSQAELRVAAMMSGDQTMLDVYRNDGDIHVRTAMGVMGIHTIEEWEKLPADVRDLKRFQAKAVNFGFLYGMWWRKFRSYAKTEYGIDFTEEEAQEIRELFFRTYPSLAHWHEDVTDYVMKHGMVRTYDGRIRHLPMVYSSDESIAKSAARMAINSPVQSIASDLGLITLGRLIPYILRKRIKWMKVCGFIHDAIVCLVREDKVAEGATLLRSYMENNPLEEWFGWKPEIPIKADAEVGRTLAKTYGLKPEMYEGKKRSYSSLLGELADNTTTKAAKYSGEDRLKLLQEAENIIADGQNRNPEKVKTRERSLRIRPKPTVTKSRGVVRKLRLVRK